MGSTVGTHDIGRAIISNNLKLACALLILPRNGESEQYKVQRQQFIDSGDVGLFPYKLYNEKKCVYGLLEDENNYQQALMRIPRNMRSMYVHAYQSYIWNACVSQRVEQHGCKVVVGDVVRTGDGRDDFGYVTKGNMAKYRIFDVVLPLPSPDIMMP